MREQEEPLVSAVEMIRRVTRMRDRDMVAAVCVAEVSEAEQAAEWAADAAGATGMSLTPPDFRAGCVVEGIPLFRTMPHSRLTILNP